MSLKFATVASLFTVAVAAGLSLWARTVLPDAPIASHFDASGHVNGHMPRDVALVFGPAVALGIAVVMLGIIPVIMPKKGRLERSSQAYGASVILVVLLICGVHAALVVRALGYPFNMPQWALGAVGVMFVVLGNYLPKTRFNYVMGIRDPWTLSDEAVWDRVHRVAGPLFMLLGVAIIADALFVPFPLAWMLMVGAAVIVTLICHGYAFITAKRLNVA